VSKCSGNNIGHGDEALRQYPEGMHKNSAITRQNNTVSHAPVH